MSFNCPHVLTSALLSLATHLREARTLHRGLLRANAPTRLVPPPRCSPLHARRSLPPLSAAAANRRCPLALTKSAGNRTLRGQHTT